MTSIEWLIEEMLSKGFFKESVTLTNIDHLQYKAEEMHKQEIIDAHIEGQRIFDKYDHTQWTTDQAEQYYQETFGSKGSDDTLKDYHIVDTNKMVDVEKLAIEEYPIFDGDLLGIANNQKHSRIDFIKGYNKAKETLYTEEQVIGFAEWILNSDSKKVLTRTKESLLKEYIESLKQPKKD